MYCSFQVLSDCDVLELHFDLRSDIALERMAAMLRKLVVELLCTPCAGSCCTRALESARYDEKEQLRTPIIGGPPGMEPERGGGLIDACDSCVFAYLSKVEVVPSDEERGPLYMNAAYYLKKTRRGIAGYVVGGARPSWWPYAVVY